MACPHSRFGHGTQFVRNRHNWRADGAPRLRPHSPAYSGINESRVAFATSPKPRPRCPANYTRCQKWHANDGPIRGGPAGFLGRADQPEPTGTHNGTKYNTCAHRRRWGAHVNARRSHTARGVRHYMDGDGCRTGVATYDTSVPTGQSRVNTRAWRNRTGQGVAAALGEAMHRVQGVRLCGVLAPPHSHYGIGQI